METMLWILMAVMMTLSVGMVAAASQGGVSVVGKLMKATIRSRNRM